MFPKIVRKCSQEGPEEVLGGSGDSLASCRAHLGEFGASVGSPGRRPGRLPRQRWAKIAPSAPNWGQVGAKLVPSWGQFGVKLGLSWTKLGPSWGQVGPSWGQDGLRLAFWDYLVHTVAILGWS